MTWESYSYSLSYSRDFLIVKLNFSLFLTKPICARPPKPAYMPAFGLKIDRPPSRHLQPALRIGSTCKGFHYSLLLITPFYSLIERTRTRLIADFDVGLRSNQFKDRGRRLRSILSMGLSEYIPDEEYFFDMILNSSRQRWLYCWHSCVVKSRKY